MYKGKVYTVSARELGVTDTKEGSYRAANEWWLAKKASIDATRPPRRHAAYLDELERRRAWAMRNGEPSIAEQIGGEMGRIERGGLPRHLENSIDLGAVPPEGFGSGPGEEPPEPTAEALAEQWADYETGSALDPGDEVWGDRVARDGPPPMPHARTVKRLVDEYVDQQQDRVKGGVLSPSEFDTIRRCVYRFRDWIGGEMPVDAIDADRWERWWRHSLSLGAELSVESQKKLLSRPRAFIEWLASKGIISPPTNLNRRQYRFARVHKAIETMTVEEVRRLVDNATSQLRLHLLLMINTGMQQKDISDLRPSEVDWDEGRIIRKRSKTKDKAGVPTVDYKLWPLTWELLQHYGKRTGERVLLTERGREWVRDWIGEDGKRHKTDSIDVNYGHLQRRLNFKKPLKLLRKTSPSLLDNHDHFGRYAIHFLGESSRTIGHEHYISPSRTQFDEAVVWLGRQYGF